MKLGIGKSKKQGSGKLTVDTANGNSNGLPLASPSPPAVVADTPKATKPPTPKEEKQGLIKKITSRVSLGKKKSKNVPAPVAVIASKPDQELERAFRVYDTDHDGRISITELSTVLTSLGGAMSEEDLNHLMSLIDTDSDGFISMEEFIQFHRVSPALASPGGVISPAHDPMRDAFQMFDKDGDNRISASELEAVLVSLGEKGHTMEECKQMIESVDKDGDGFVDFQEFRELMGSQDEEPAPKPATK